LWLGPVALAEDTSGVVDVTSGVWTLHDGNDTSTFFYGNPGDRPFMGDWNCDGVDTPGLYRQSDGFVYLRNTNTQGIADIRFFFGNPGDVPIAGDFDGNGCDTVSIYRPSEARFYIINQLGTNDGGLGAADFSYIFGNPGDVPFVGDWNDDNIDTAGLRRPSDGFVYLRNTNSQGVADIAFFYGNPGDIPFAGDWNGDGVDSIGLYRPSSCTTFLRNSLSTGIADSSLVIGTQPNSLPVAGDFGSIGGAVTPAGVPPLTLTTVVSGLSSPVFATAAPGDCRLYVVEQVGDIEIIENGSRLPTPFLDIPVTCCGERGLLGLAFHPNYVNNGLFYVNYKRGLTTVISEFQVSADRNRANHDTERILLEIPQTFDNHNGGMLAFAPDGTLLISTGDGGGGGDTEDNAENPNRLLGKILRIDVNSGSPYAIPSTNPYRNGGGRAEVWLLGLRNPWRFSIDGNSHVYIGDVGQGTTEELDAVPVGSGGLNLGWNTWEGNGCFEAPCNTGGFTFPVHQYANAGAACAVTGGYVYRGTAIPDLAGTYFYGDFCAGWIRSFRLSGGVATEHKDWTSDLGTVGALSSFGIGPDGELYVVSLNGSIHKLVVEP